MKLKKGDKVIVIAGKDKGSTGAIVRVLPRENKIIVDGINIAKRHRRPSAKSNQGAIVEMAMPIHASNVMLADPKTGKPSRVRISRDDKGVRSRVAQKSGQEVK